MGTPIGRLLERIMSGLVGVALAKAAAKLTKKIASMASMALLWFIRLVVRPAHA